MCTRLRSRKSVRIVLGELASAAVVRTVIASALVASVVLAGSPARAESPNATSSTPLRVLAASSLTEVVEALAAGFPDGEIAASFGASSDLARQIKDGAPADVFLSASPEWIDFLREAGALIGEPVLVARNALVCVAPRDGPMGAHARKAAAGAAADAAANAAAGAATNAATRAAEVRDPRALLERIDAADEIVAIANAGVPAGDYARKALAALGLEAAFEPRLVGQRDVRAVLNAVEQGEVAAGFVYATDARIARVETLFAFDPTTHPPIEYLAAIIRNADSSASKRSPEGWGNAAAAGATRNADVRGRADLARRFVAYLRSDAARARLSAAGFVLP